MKRKLVASVAVAVPFACASARADTTWLPGADRGIPRATSASRDTPAFEYAYGPRAQASIGAEPGLFATTSGASTFRVGFYALAALENATSDRVFPPSELWRGLIGVSFAIEMPKLARTLFVRGSDLEIALVVGHESDHATEASTSALAPPGPLAIPFGGGGDFLAPEIAWRLPLGRAARVTMRLEDRVYFNELPLFVGARVASDVVADTLHEGLVNAAAGDVIVEWHLAAWATPRLALFAEHLFAHDAFVPGGQRARVMAGVGLPGRVGEIEPFVSFDGGNGEGILVQERALRLSVGVRYAPF